MYRAIEKKKRQNASYFKGKSPPKIRENLLRIEMLQLLGVDEKTIRNIVAKVEPPYDFELSAAGHYGDEKTRVEGKEV
ncbi:MAG: hypothetical protein M1490_01095 [Candidatus Bathyarchaeota archaeon]|nr:hypothetical protein [Candidatus Bathyarchaeota archaeon]